MNVLILQAERRYQRQSGNLIRRRWLRLLEDAVLIAGLVIALGLFALEVWSAAVHTDLAMLLADHNLLQLLILNILPLLLLPLTLVVHFGLLLRALMLSTGVIRREQIGGTWELLRLTDQSPARIILSKWAATISTLASQYFALALLRVGVIVFIGLELFRFDNFYLNRNSVQFFFAVKPLPFVIEPRFLVIGALLIVLFTFANLLLTTALGVLISAVRRGGHVGDQIAIAVVLRTALFALPALLLIPQVQSADYYTAVTMNTLGYSLLDNGTLISAAFLTEPRDHLNFSIGTIGSTYYPADVIPILFGVYALIVVVSLAAAIWIVGRQSD